MLKFIQIGSIQNRPDNTFMPEKYSELFDNIELNADGEYWEV